MQFQSLIIGFSLGCFQLGVNGFRSNSERATGHEVVKLHKRTRPSTSYHRIPKYSMETGISMLPETGVLCGTVQFSKGEIYQKGDIACTEYTRMRKNPLVKFNSVGNVHRTHNRFNSQRQKFYIYPLLPLESDENGIYKPTPYVVITKQCSVVAVYLRTFSKPKAMIIKKSKFDICWEGRNNPEGFLEEPSSPTPSDGSSDSSENQHL
ncbi:BgTH12-07153 [Blumeria graminis f. sp. triticale]|uniref:Bgt-50406 n=2 Tax=Blumeria graminis TaxID=34373 RepID=A0A9X9MPM8_BLUGR|nr:BgTH12-07153 [Blumeria graminis f. sp. triticale]VDB94977.1 Bgt-50406 [Blumeria graminis f. sp. tritici]